MNQPAPKPTDGPLMHDLAVSYIKNAYGDYALEDSPSFYIISLMEERRATGIKTYGTPLQAHNGRDPVQDAIEEFADALVYLFQCREEAELNGLKLVYEHIIESTLDSLYTLASGKLFRQGKV